MIESEPLSISPRAQRVGVVVIAPRETRPADLMVACHFWPQQLKQAGVTRVAVVLGVEAYLVGRGVFTACRYKMYERGVEVAYFHEGHLESDQIRAWFEMRKPRRRVTSDSLVKLSERCVARGDMRAAFHAVRLAEVTAELSDA